MRRAKWVIAAALLCLLLGETVTAQAVTTSAKAAVLLDVSSGEWLYEQNADEPMLVASTTKILTALTALRHYDTGEAVTVTAEAAGTEGSSMYLRAGEKLTVEELLCGLLLASGNDAAETLARHCGQRERFVGWMNALAAELGMTGSHFENPSGLDGEDHRATARDMARLMAAAMDEPEFVRIVSTRTMTVGARTLTNHNKLLSQVAGCIGGKTGYTRAAGRTLVSCAERGGVRLVAVTLCDGDDWADHAALYDYGFALPRAAAETALLLPAGEAAETENKETTGFARLLEGLRALL